MPRILRLRSGISRRANCWPREWPRQSDEEHKMAELEIHHEHEVEADPIGKKVGILAAVLAVFLAIVTIESHRAHTEGILLKTEANDQWNFYQAERLKLHNLEVGEGLISVLAPTGEGAAE